MSLPFLMRDLNVFLPGLSLAYISFVGHFGSSGGGYTYGSGSGFGGFGFGSGFGGGGGGATVITVLFGRIYSTGSGLFHKTPMLPQKHRLSIPMKPNRSRVIVLSS
jgi:hypothetical protein